MSIFDPRDESMNDITDEAITDSAQRHQQRTWPTAQDAADLKDIREAREEGGSIPLGEFLDDDSVNHPAHYQGAGGLEAIDVIEAFLGTEGTYYYCRGNALKYELRAGEKGDAAQDHRKASWYAERAATLWEKINAEGNAASGVA